MLIESDKEKSKRHDRDVSLLDTADLRDKINIVKVTLMNAIGYLHERQKYSKSSEDKPGLFNNNQDDEANVSVFIKEAEEVIRSAGVCETYIEEMKKDPGHPGN